MSGHRRRSSRTGDPLNLIRIRGVAETLGMDEELLTIYQQAGQDAMYEVVTDRREIREV